jgi:hypothetical protein
VRVRWELARGTHLGHGLIRADQASRRNREGMYQRAAPYPAATTSAPSTANPTVAQAT